jgi:RNA-directed DNA polymerase
MCACAAVRMGQFVILCGNTGVGKTSLVSRAADALGGETEIVPVRPAWTEPSDLIGFFN